MYNFFQNFAQYVQKKPCAQDILKKARTFGRGPS
jgi:hypothetical protein